MQQPIERYKNKLSESILGGIIKFLAARKLNKKLKGLEKSTGDADIEASIESFKYYMNELNRKVKDFCRREPNHKVCKKYRRGLKLK